MQKYSVLMAVYVKDKPEYFAVALDSMINQTVPPDEIVVVKDGPITKGLQEVMEEREKAGAPIHEVALETNQGLGPALDAGLKACRNELVARMDSDDIAIPDRCAKQRAYMLEHPEIAVLGGQIEEFVEDEQHIVGKRCVPLSDAEIKAYMQTRCPFNHVTVMVRKSAIVSEGGYRPWFSNEDYYLWIRLHLAGMKFANLPETLVHVRVGKDMYQRRGGMRYFQSEFGIQRLMLEKGLIGYGRFGMNVLARLVLQVLMPNWLRGIAFQKFART